MKKTAFILFGLMCMATIAIAQETPNSAAAEIKEDFVPSVMNQPGQEYPMVNSQGYARFRIHAPEAQSVIVKLKNRSGNTNVVKIADNSILGATFKALDKHIAEKFRLNSGIQIDTIDKNGALAKAGLKKDFIILKVNGQPIRSEKDLTTIVNQTINANDQDRALFITGAYTNGQIAHFAVNLE